MAYFSVRTGCVKFLFILVVDNDWCKRKFAICYYHEFIFLVVLCCHIMCVVILRLEFRVVMYVRYNFPKNNVRFVFTPPPPVCYFRYFFRLGIVVSDAHCVVFLFLWIVQICLPLRYSLTFNDFLSFSRRSFGFWLTMLCPRFIWFPVKYMYRVSMPV